jgi:hypothetical protein
MKGERRLEDASIGELFSNPKGIDAGWLGAEDFAQDVVKLNAADAQQTQTDTINKVDRFFESLDTILNGPESGWLLFDDPPAVDPQQPLSARIYDIVRPTFSKVFRSELKERTQLRLAYLTATAIEYRWINGHLPERIEQFTTKDERRDPTTGKNFSYEIIGNWFKISRIGKDALGIIQLQRPPRAPAQDSTARAELVKAFAF